jgi:prepilin-type N-terminal cleavage/methylation domain-containing protein
MRPASIKKREHGFTLIEMLVALGIFLLVTGAAFTLLTSSQQQYQTENQLLNSFQEARLGLDQMVRDINDAGFPPPSYLASPTPPSPYDYLASVPFAWSAGAGYFANPCQIQTGGGGTCTTAAGGFAPGDFDIIIETNPDPSRDPACAPTCPVQWIRYQLGGPNGTTLMRGAANKQAGQDPDTFTTNAGLVPFVENVVNNSPNLQIGQFQLSAAYPVLFPAGAPVPIFQYTCDTPISAPQNAPTSCPGLGNSPDNSPANIRDVVIALIVAAPTPDSTTGRPRLVQLAGRGRRINPNQ